MATQVLAQSELASRLWDALVNRREIIVLGDMLVPSPFAPAEATQEQAATAAPSDAALQPQP